MRVTVVFDRNFGAQEQPDMGDAFWLIESPTNCALAERLWAAGMADLNSAVFKGHESESLGEDALSRFEDVDLHHGNWTAIAFVGISLTWDLRKHFTRYGFTITGDDQDFVVAR